MCVSHQAILSKMDEMAAGFEQKIQEWKECLVKELFRKCMHMESQSVLCYTLDILSLCLHAGSDNEVDKRLLAS